MSLIDVLKKNRPNLSQSTLYSYCSTLNALHKKIWGTNDVDVENFNDVEKVLKELENRPSQTRKTQLAILYVLTNKKEYQDEMVKDIQSYEKQVDKQEMNDKQKENFKTQDEIKDKLERLKENANILYKKKQLTPKDKQEIQNYIILCLTSGAYIPPRRSLDWCQFKCKNITDGDNCLIKNKFIFNTFKGSAKKGTQEIQCPSELKKILNKWCSVNENDYLLYDQNGNPLNSVKMNQRLCKILGDRSAINTLRHSYVSTNFQDLIEKQNELEKTMNEMGSSQLQKNIYLQKTT